MVVQKVTVSRSTGIRVSTDNCTRRVDSASSAADCAWRVKTGDYPPLGHDETVVSARVASGATGRVGTGKSCHFTGGVAPGKLCSGCSLEVKRCVCSLLQNETMAR